MDGLVWSDGLLEEGRQVRAQVAGALAELAVPGEVELTGGLSVPGSLTKGDVDLHLRVPPDAFEGVVRTLRHHLPVASAQAWAATLAVFDVPGPRPTGLAVTPRGSEHDRRFRRAWERLRREPELLARYNAVKAESVDPADYEDRKSRFLSALTETGSDAPGSAPLPDG